MIRALLAVIMVTSGLGCAKLDDMFKMPKKMDSMNRSVDRTNETVERQPVLLAFEAMMKEEYAVDLLPIPFNIMGFAKEFGKYATVEDLVELFYVKIKELNEVVIESETPTPEQIKAFNHKKSHTLILLQAVAGLLPDEKVKAIVRERILTDDRFRDSALSLLMMRVEFINQVLLDESVLHEPITAVGTFEKAVEYANSIEYIARLPFTDRIKVEITGFYNPDKDDLIETLDPKATVAIWEKIKKKAVRGLSSIQPQEWTGDKASDEALYLERQRRYEAALAVTNQRIQDWQTKP
jgi:hypothetical protein